MILYDFFFCRALYIRVFPRNKSGKVTHIYYESRERNFPQGDNKNKLRDTQTQLSLVSFYSTLFNRETNIRRFISRMLLDDEAAASRLGSHEALTVF